MLKEKQHVTAWKTVLQPDTHIFQKLHDLHISVVLVFFTGILYYGSMNSTNRLLQCKTVTRQAM